MADGDYVLDHPGHSVTNASGPEDSLAAGAGGRTQPPGKWVGPGEGRGHLGNLPLGPGEGGGCARGPNPSCCRPFPTTSLLRRRRQAGPGSARSRGGSAREGPSVSTRPPAHVFGGGQGQDGARPAPLAAEGPCPAQGRPSRRRAPRRGGKGTAEPSHGGPRAQAAEADGARGAPGARLDAPRHGADAVPQPGVARRVARGPPGARLPGAARGGAPGAEEPLLPFPGAEPQAGRPSRQQQRWRACPSGPRGHLPAAARPLRGGARLHCRRRAPGTGWPRSRACAASEPGPGGSGQRGGLGRAAGERGGAGGGGGGGGGRAAPAARRRAEGPRVLRQRRELPLQAARRRHDRWRCRLEGPGGPVMRRACWLPSRPGSGPTSLPGQPHLAPTTA